VSFGPTEPRENGYQREKTCNNFKMGRPGLIIADVLFADVFVLERSGILRPVYQML